MSGKTIVVLATLDTKGVEAAYLREQIARFGDAALLVDTGVVGAPPPRPTSPARRSPRPGACRWRRSWSTRTARWPRR